MHPGSGPPAHATQIPACREFETHPGFPFTRELDEATPGNHARSFSLFNHPPFNPPCFRFASVARPILPSVCWQIRLSVCVSAVGLSAWLLPKKFFWKNEAKLCPSLLGFSEKQSQTEPKKSQISAVLRPIEPKIPGANPKCEPHQPSTFNPSTLQQSHPPSRECRSCARSLPGH